MNVFYWYKLIQTIKKPAFIMNTETVQTKLVWVQPEVFVYLSDIDINVKARTFTAKLELSDNVKPNAKSRKITESMQISGNVTLNTIEWLTLLRKEIVERKDENGNIIKEVTGRSFTGFQKFLMREDHQQPIAFKPGILKELVFGCPNTSPSYISNPFKVTSYYDLETGEVMHVLSLVTEYPKKMVQYMDPGTGKVVKSFSDRHYVDAEGNRRKQFYKPEYYYRYKFHKVVEVAS